MSKVIAVGGSSAGAIIALGIWAGLSPREIKDYLHERCGMFGLVPSIFSVGDIVALIWSLFVALLAFVYNVSRVVLNWPLTLINHFAGKTLGALLGKDMRMSLPPWNPYFGCPGAKFERFLNELIWYGLKKRNIHRELVAALYPGVERLTFRNILAILVFIRAINAIGSAEDDDFKSLALEAFPELTNRLTAVHFEPEVEGQPKNNIFKLVFEQTTAFDAYFPPLFLSAVSLHERKPVIFNNLEEEFLDFEIARMVRISAGHPAVFRPKRLRKQDEAEGYLDQKRFVDGGVLVNFPVSQMIAAIQRALSDSADIDEYEDILRTTFITIGMATEEPQSGRGSYVSAVWDMISGGARALLELELANRVAFFRLLSVVAEDQPHYLNFFGLRKSLIDQVYARTREFAEGQGAMTVLSLEASRQRLEASLADACRAIDLAFSEPGAAFSRAHLFIDADPTNNTITKLAMYCRHEATKFNDHEISITKPRSGLIGLARATRRPVICRIDQLQALRRAHPRDEILGLRWEEVKHIPEELNFCVVIPIFNHYSLSYSESDSDHATQRYDGLDPQVEGLVRILESGIDGQLLAVISIDGSMNVDDDLDVICARFKSMLAMKTLERIGTDVGYTIGSALAANLHAAA